MYTYKHNLCIQGPSLDSFFFDNFKFEQEEVKIMETKKVYSTRMS